MLLGTLGASLLGNILTGRGKNRAGERIERASCGNTKKGKNNNKMDLMVSNGFLTTTK